MNGSRDAGAESVDEGGLSPALLGIGVGVVDVAVFAYLGLELVDDPVFGAFVGLVLGIGTYLFLPGVMARDRERDTDDLEPVTVGTRVRSFHRTAAGLALPPAGIMLFAWRLINDSLLLGVIGTAVIALAIYVPLAVLLPRHLA
ncbi:hypothetical protein CP556_05970 [Natrinema sp. CBA1119]|uniref:hypothetical protein n=1 Tax=Natrinema sp. CBA1119 TaxID=1608465 RepID=UPI000BF7A2B1|nr:hypothetical protein [Natrinema sp. CBA1119]PGF15708.1 hypothetical protein CP556_05970 [Natrinema sp. CBA1119]